MLQEGVRGGEGACGALRVWSFDAVLGDELTTCVDGEEVVRVGPEFKGVGVRGTGAPCSGSKLTRCCSFSRPHGMDEEDELILTSKGEGRLSDLEPRAPLGWPLEPYPLQARRGRHVALVSDVEVVRLVRISRLETALTRRDADIEERAKGHAYLPDDDARLFQ